VSLVPKMADTPEQVLGFLHDLAAKANKAATAIVKIAEENQIELTEKQRKQLSLIEGVTAGRKSFDELPAEDRWEARMALFRASKDLAKFGADNEKVAKEVKPHLKAFKTGIEFVPLWVVVCTALALGIGTTIGYKRIVVTVAEKIGKTHLSYAQGAVAELVASSTIMVAAYTGMPVSTTHVLSSGVAGTMAANGSGLQGATVKRIGLAWLLTLPVCMVLSGTFFLIGRAFFN